MRVLNGREQRESEVQASVIRFYRAFNCDVAHFSERRTSRITPGWPDLMVFPPRGHIFAHETKAEGGRQSSAQSTIQAWFERCGIAYVTGGVGEAHQHLVRVGLAEP